MVAKRGCEASIDKAPKALGEEFAQQFLGDPASLLEPRQLTSEVRELAEQFREGSKDDTEAAYRLVQSQALTNVIGTILSVQSRWADNQPETEMASGRAHMRMFQRSIDTWGSFSREINDRTLVGGPNRMGVHLQDRVDRDTWMGYKKWRRLSPAQKRVRSWDGRRWV